MPFERDNLTWSKHVANGEAFSAENFIIPGGGLLGHMQLFNPVLPPPGRSPVRVRLRSVHQITAVGIAASNVRRHDVALAILGPPVPFINENLLGGQPVPVGEMRGAALVAAVGSTFWQLNAPVAQPAIYPPEGRDWGHDLLPGQGILLQAAASVVLIVNWMWVEVPL